MKQLNNVAMKQRLIKILLILAILLAGLAASLLVYNVAYSHWTKDIDKNTQQFENAYAQSLKQETDLNRLARRGVKFIQTNQLKFASLTLKRATELDKNDRDAWLWLGYAALLSGDSSTALNALKTAENLDPINPLTYEFLNLTYEKLGDTAGAAKANEKYQYLVKSE